MQRPETPLPAAVQETAAAATADRLYVIGGYDGQQRSLSSAYVFDTTTGGLVGRIHTDPSPHGLAVWPQPGRYSLGHTGNTR